MHVNVSVQTFVPRTPKAMQFVIVSNLVFSFCPYVSAINVIQNVSSSAGMSPSLSGSCETSAMRLP